MRKHLAMTTSERVGSIFKATDVIINIALRKKFCLYYSIYNTSGRVVSDIQALAFGSSLYIRYNTDANVVNDLKNDSSYEFIGEVILKINVV